MTTENIRRRLDALKELNPHSRKFAELANRLEIVISNVKTFEVRDSLMESLTKICTQ